MGGARQSGVCRESSLHMTASEMLATDLNVLFLLSWIMLFVSWKSNLCHSSVHLKLFSVHYSIFVAKLICVLLVWCHTNLCYELLQYCCHKEGAAQGCHGKPILNGPVWWTFFTREGHRYLHPQLFCFRLCNLLIPLADSVAVIRPTICRYTTFCGVVTRWSWRTEPHQRYYER